MSVIHELISEGEHQQQDFKLRIDDSKKIAITLSAFANTNGGKLLIGVKDNGNIAGVKSVEEEYHMVKAAAEMYCKPAIELTPSVIREQGKNVLIVDIPKTTSPPILAKNPEDKWRPYLRLKDENFMMNRVLAKSLDVQMEEKKSFEFKPNLLAFLQEMKHREHFGFNITRRRLKMPAIQTENLLAALIRWDVIGYQMNANGIQYFVEEEQIHDLYQ